MGQIFNFKDGEAVIIGGGSVAVDAARTAIRTGASKVTVVSLETGSDLPATRGKRQKQKKRALFLSEDTAR